MWEGGVDGLLFWLLASSSEATACATPIFFVWEYRESVIVSTVIPVQASGKQGNIKKYHPLEQTELAEWLQ